MESYSPESLKHDEGRSELLTAGTVLCHQVALIGLIGIFYCGFSLEYRIIHGHCAFQELFRMESDPEMRFDSC